MLERCRRAAWSMDERERRRLLTAVVVGAGWSGVVWAGALAATLRRMAASLRLPRDSVTVYLVEADERVMPRTRGRSRRTRASCSDERRRQRATASARDRCRRRAV